MWCIPPQEDARFVAAMEDVLEVYERPYDEHCPVVCLDEAAKQILGQVREPLPMSPHQCRREDNEYERQGTCALFMLFEPLAGQREVVVRERRTQLDYAQVVRSLCDEMYPAAERIVLVQDNLNTHGVWSLYQAFEPREAQRLARRIEWHYTPRHGSWLNMAEIELSVLARQCLKERVESQENLEIQVWVWQERRNVGQVAVDWHFSVSDARCKLKRLYPKILRG
jgi:DDE superfamily endonuclease